MALCATELLSRQIQHRNQVDPMPTAAGAEPEPTSPSKLPWLLRFGLIPLKKPPFRLSNEMVGKAQLPDLLDFRHLLRRAVNSTPGFTKRIDVQHDNFPSRIMPFESQSCDFVSFPIAKLRCHHCAVACVIIHV